MRWCPTGFARTALMGCVTSVLASSACSSQPCEPAFEDVRVDVSDGGVTPMLPDGGVDCAAVCPSAQRCELFDNGDTRTVVCTMRVGGCA